MQKDKFSEDSELRRKAEKLIKKKESERKTQLSEVETLKLIHELEVHQIELEMQKDELERYQEELQQSLLRYSGLYDFAPIGYFTLSEKGKIIEVNLTAASMLGRNRGDMIGMEISHLIFLDDLDIFYSHRQKLFENHEQQVCEIRMISSDGGLFWARMEATLTYDTENNRACFVVMSNITEHKESEEKYRMLVENSGLGVGLYSIDGKILYFNQKAVQNMGGNPEDFIGKPLKEVFGEQTASIYINRFQEVVKSNKSLEFEDFVELPSGNYWFLSNHTCIKNPDGTVFGVQVLAHDITERKIAEIKLKEGEEKFRVLSFLSPVGIYVTDPQGNCQYTNRKWCEMAGLSEDEALGTGWIKGIHPDDREMVFSKWQQMIDSEGSWGMDYRFRTQGGKISWVHGLAVSQSDDNNQIIGYIGVNIDITEQKEAENALIESEDKYKKLVELSPDAIVVHSEGKIIYVNTAAVESMGGTSADDLIGRNALDFVHPDYKSLAMERIRDLMVNNTKAGLTHEKFIRLDGKVIDVETTAIPFIYGGKPSVQLIVRDVTDRIRMEEARLESETKYQTLFECNNDALFLMDQDTFIECNPKTMEMFGCTREQIIGKSPYSFSPEYQPDGSASEKKAEEKITAALGGFEQIFEWRHCRYDGTQFDAEVRLNDITIKDKKYLQASVRDITQRKIIEAELRQNEAQYRLLADNMTDMVWTMDLELNTTYISPSVEKLRGYTLEELKQIPVKERLTPESYRILMDLYSSEMPKIISDPAYSYPDEVDLELYHKNGTSYWLEILFTVIRDANNNPVSILCVGRDITLHKAMSEKLKENEEKLNMFFSQSLDGFFFMMLDEPVVWNDSTDKEKALDYIFSHQRVTKVNKSMLDQYGATEEQFKGYTPADFFAHDIDQGRRVWKDFFDNGHLHVDTKEKKFDGTDMIIEGDYILLYDSEKRIIGEFGIQRDVTAIRKAEKALQNSAMQLRFITDHLPVLIAHVDTEKRYKMVNRPYADLFGMNPDDLIGKYVPEILGEKNFKIAEPYMDLVLSGQTSGYEMEIYDKQGSPRTVSVFYIPEKDPEGNIAGFIAAISDITDRKQSEEKIKKQLEELQRWHLVTLGREDRNRELKREVNELLIRLGEAIRYPSQENSSS